jgi:hypothetical protein
MLSIAAAALLLGAQDPSAFDGRARATEAVETVRPVAYRSAQVDWPALESELTAMAATARDTVDMLPVYRRLLDALGDHHSFVQASDELNAAYQDRRGRDLYGDVVRPPQASTFGGRDMIEHREVAVSESRSVQWIAVPKVFGSGERARAYASHLFTATADVPPRNCGYIVDVRGNTGGNVWPMLTGLSGLLGDGPAGRETKPDGRVTTYAELKDGAAIIVEDGEFKGREIIASASWRSIPALETSPVAVLMDDSTASSGEGVVVAFRGRSNTRSFGHRTVGVSTSNEGFELSDGVNLVVTVGVMTDRQGTAYPQGLEPDESVAFTPPVDGGEDSQIEAARNWLAAQPQCAAAS